MRIFREIFLAAGTVLLVAKPDFQDPVYGETILIAKQVS
jgi:hypothetical protein